MIRPSWIEMLVSSRMRVLAPLAAATGAIGLKSATSTAQGTPAPVDADELLLRAAFRMQDVSSYRFDLTLEQGQIEVVPEVFKMGDDNAEVISSDVPAEQEDAVKAAAEDCPVEAIQVS